MFESVWQRSLTLSLSSMLLLWLWMLANLNIGICRSTLRWISIVNKRVAEMKIRVISFSESIPFFLGERRLQRFVKHQNGRWNHTNVNTNEGKTKIFIFSYLEKAWKVECLSMKAMKRAEVMRQWDYVSTCGHAGTLPAEERASQKSISFQYDESSWPDACHVSCTYETKVMSVTLILS